MCAATPIFTSFSPSLVGADVNCLQLVPAFHGR
jgi:hypothetical protein